MVRLQAAAGTSSRPSSLVAARSCRTCRMWLCREATRGLCSTSMATRHRCLAMSRYVQQLLQPVAICLQVTGDLQQQLHHACCKQAVLLAAPFMTGCAGAGTHGAAGWGSGWRLPQQSSSQAGDVSGCGGASAALTQPGSGVGTRTLAPRGEGAKAAGRLLVRVKCAGGTLFVLVLSAPPVGEL